MPGLYVPRSGPALPYRKPPLGSVIDRSHPSAWGLTQAWVMNEGGGLLLHDLCGNTDLVGNSSLPQPAWGADLAGHPALLGTTANAQQVWTGTVPPGFWSATSTISGFFLCRFSGTTSFADVLDIWSTGGHLVLVQLTTSTHTLFVGNAALVLSATWQGQWGWCGFTVSPSGAQQTATVALCFDGGTWQTASGTGSGAVAPTGVSLLSEGGGFGNPWSGTLAFLYLWTGRVLSLSDFQALAAAPYQFVRRPLERTWVPALQSSYTAPVQPAEAQAHALAPTLTGGTGLSASAAAAPAQAHAAPPGIISGAGVVLRVPPAGVQSHAPTPAMVAGSGGAFATRAVFLRAAGAALGAGSAQGWQAPVWPAGLAVRGAPGIRPALALLVRAAALRTGTAGPRVTSGSGYSAAGQAAYLVVVLPPGSLIPQPVPEGGRQYAVPTRRLLFQVPARRLVFVVQGPKGAGMGLEVVRLPQEMGTAETQPYGFDFTACLASGETVTGAGAELVQELTGLVQQAGAGGTVWLAGVPVVAGNVVTQTVTGLAPGYDYRLRVLATTSAGNVYEAVLPLRCPLES